VAAGSVLVLAARRRRARTKNAAIPRV